MGAQDRSSRPCTLEDFQLADEASAALADWARTYLGGATLNAAARNRLKFLVMSAATGEPCSVRLAVSEDPGRVSIEFLPGVA